VVSPQCKPVCANADGGLLLMWGKYCSGPGVRDTTSDAFVIHRWMTLYRVFDAVDLYECCCQGCYEACMSSVAACGLVSVGHDVCMNRIMMVTAHCWLPVIMATWRL
jgi:hypothetical protein